MLKARELRGTAAPRKEALAVTVDHRRRLPSSCVLDGRHADAARDHILRRAHSTSYRVDGRSTGLTGGVCDRTWGVRNRLVTLVADADDCSEVTDQPSPG